jgi:hypothetical protein
MAGFIDGCHNAYGEGKQIFSTKDKEKVARSLERYPARRLAGYGFSQGLSVAQRINRRPQQVLAYLKDYDGRKDYRIYHPTAQERRLIRRVWQQLPNPYRKVLRRRLVGIYFVENFWGNGFTEWLVDEQKRVYTFIAFNKRVLKLSAQQLINKREQTCFHPKTEDKAQTRVKIRLRPDKPGFLYIFAHESTHVLDYTHNITPFTDPSFGKYFELGSKKHHHFWRQSWRSYFVPQAKTRLFRHKKISFYGFKKGPHLKLKQAVPLYRSLQKSDFVSLYSALSWAEDLAELGSFYILTQKQGISYEIQVWQNDRILFAYEPWQIPRIRRRMEFAYRQIQQTIK